MGQKHVLIVDDEPDLVTLLQYSLQSEDIRCSTAHDGEEGLAIAKRERPDLILLDVMLPKMHGYKLARLLKYDSEYKAIPIIMLTARAQLRDIAIGTDVGADEYVTKPFDMTTLIELVKKYLHQQ